MKILYLEHPEPDLGSTQLSMGLRQVLGDDNVVDFPYKHSLHGQEEHLQGIDIKDFLRDNPLIFPDGERSKSAKLFDWLIPSKSREYRYSETVDMIKRGVFDLILITPRSVCTYYLRRLINDCKYDMPPVILCDFEDYNEIRFDILNEFSSYIKLMTKANYVPDKIKEYEGYREYMNYNVNCKIYPLPLSSPIVDNHIYHFDDSNENKTIDIHARFGLTRSLRKDIVESLKRLKDDKLKDDKRVKLLFQGGISLPDHPDIIMRNGKHICGDGGITAICELDNHLPYSQYLQEIATSKISVSVRGHGNCGNPNRHWEIPSYNTLMLCEAPNSYYEHPFEDGKTCMFFDSEIKDDVCEKAIYWLKDENENERRKIARAGNEHLEKYHTCKKRAERLLEIVHIECLV